MFSIATTAIIAATTATEQMIKKYLLFDFYFFNFYLY